MYQVNTIISQFGSVFAQVFHHFELDFGRILLLAYDHRNTLNMANVPKHRQLPSKEQGLFKELLVSYILTFVQNPVMRAS